MRGLIGDLKESSIPQDFCTIGGRRQISFKTGFPRLQANNQIRVLSEIFYLIQSVLIKQTAELEVHAVCYSIEWLER
ncbi:hypothetical protein AP3564_15580 [Aeribacillus pallidus]|uniref:Uncharacterized protein n=1 Tax=Aeribacillus pallidus TaxID=33936 RepID=A0A223E8J3_9BACI|nr:hypothetical protein AP3564_15580 [Aeribacillus pallidus]